MSNDNQKYKHLTYKERTIIAFALTNKASFSTIDKTLNRNKSTVAREVKKNFTIKKANLFNNGANNICAKRHACKLEALCKICDSTKQISCSSCKKCNSVCPEFDPVCRKLKHAPFVCNGCKSRITCKMQKHIYDADDADKMYNDTLSIARRDPSINKDFVKVIDTHLTTHLQNGKSIHNFLITENKYNCVSASTIYRWLKADYFSIKADNIPSLKRKYTKKYAYPKPKSKNILSQRTYADYLNRIKVNEPFETVQMDTVLGKKGSKKVILTMLFTKTKLLLAFLLDRKNLACVQQTVQYINKLLLPINKSLHDIAPVILLDNGSEFANPLAFEMDCFGNIKSSVFYCDPYTATQRAQIERAHVELRKILPKGSSFDNLSQKQLDFICSHLNSYKLTSLNNKSPLDLFAFAYGAEFIKALNLQHIDDRDIVRNNTAMTKLLPNL